MLGTKIQKIFEKFLHDPLHYFCRLVSSVKFECVRKPSKPNPFRPIRIRLVQHHVSNNHPHVQSIQ